ncbi:MAG TPA: M48 family metallopeptidase [Solirubrobacteraceae bacterium]|jgi:Zn-dependent protease with chaperone function
MSDPLPDDQRLKGISPKAYEHPADRAATAALKSIPMLDTVVRKLIELQYERALRQRFLAGSIRLGPDQLPETWADHVAATTRLDLPETYDLYLTQAPFTNAAAIGAGKPMVVINSRTVDLLDVHEVRTVLGHEAGHILSDHVLYRTALMILLSATGLARLPVLGGLPLLAVRLALLEWFRAAELSCDRAATLVNRDPLITCRTLMVLAAGMPSSKLNVDAFMRQAREYEEWDSGWDKLARLGGELTLTHSHPVRRAHEVMSWVQAGDFDRIMGGDYRTRDQEAASPRQEAGDAVEFYSERFRKVFRDVGESVEKAGGSLADAGERFGDWLRTRQ